MKHDFRIEYEDYMDKKTPDLWSRIEKGIAEEVRENREVPRENQEVPGRNHSFRFIRILAAAAAVVCVIGLSARTFLLNRRGGEAAGNLESQVESRSEDKASSGAASSAQKNDNDLTSSEGADTAASMAQETETSMLQETETTMSQEEDIPRLQEKGTTTSRETGTALSRKEGIAMLQEKETEIFQGTETAMSQNMMAATPREAGTELSVESEAAFEVSGTSKLTSQYMRIDSPASGSFVANSGETYAETTPSGFSLVATDPLSTFSADVDTASYANVRRMIEDGYGKGQINPDAVRPEEFINYFSYELKSPEEGEKFGVTTKIGTCPWNEKHQILFIGMRTEELDMSEAPAENLTFLLDVSGSMDEPDKLPLLQKSFLQLIDQLDEEDTVSIVTYANGVEVVLDSAKGSEKSAIADAINSLKAEGGTYGEGGIQKAYELAERNFRQEANNRIILATDGDLNIGISQPEDLEKFIREKRDKGIGLSVLGFGTGNIRDDNMERLADCGNGNYSYIDSVLEARKVMIEEMGASFHTVAEDVRLQVEFNPAFVNAWRLIGYENRLMDAADFRNDQKDAGEIGAGHNVVALYELIPAESEEAVELKYQKKQQKAADADDEYCTVTIRYKEPGEAEGQEADFVVDTDSKVAEPDEDLTFVSAVAELAMILRDDQNKGAASLEGILETGRSFKTDDEYKQEFFYLVRLLLKNS